MIEESIKQAIIAAARNGDIKAFGNPTWAITTAWLNDAALMTCLIDEAASNGHLAMLEWLYTVMPRNCAGASIRALNEAAANGNLGIVKWLTTNTTARCTKWAMDMAAANGHLEMLKWLFENRTEGCSTDAMEWAACRGHLHIVQWLYRVMSKGNERIAIGFAVANGHREVAEWMHKNIEDVCCYRCKIQSPLCVSVVASLDHVLKKNKEKEKTNEKAMAEHAEQQETSAAAVIDKTNDHSSDRCSEKTTLLDAVQKIDDACKKRIECVAVVAERAALLAAAKLAFETQQRAHDEAVAAATVALDELKALVAAKN
jgi:hypothetical protein